MKITTEINGFIEDYVKELREGNASLFVELVFLEGQDMLIGKDCYVISLTP